MIGIGTDSILEDGTGTDLKRYRYCFATASVVPVPLQRGIGTGLRFCPEMAEFTIFHALFFHKSLLLHPSSKTNMESL